MADDETSQPEAKVEETPGDDAAGNSAAKEAAKAAELLHITTGDRAVASAYQFLRQLPTNPSVAQMSVLLDLIRIVLRFRPAAVHDREAVLRSVIVDCVDSMPSAADEPMKMMAWKDYLGMVKGLRTPGAAPRRPGPATPGSGAKSSGGGEGGKRKRDVDSYFPIDSTTVLSIYSKRPRAELQSVTPRILPSKQEGKSIYSLDRPIIATNTLPDGSVIRSQPKKNRLVQVESSDETSFHETVKKLAEESNYGTNIPRHYFSQTVLRKFHW